MCHTVSLRTGSLALDRQAAAHGHDPLHEAAAPGENRACEVDVQYSGEALEPKVRQTVTVNLEVAAQMGECVGWGGCIRRVGVLEGWLHVLEGWLDDYIEGLLH